VSADRPIVVVTDHPWPSLEIEAAVLGAVGARLLDADGIGRDDLLELTRDASGILTCFARVDAEIINNAPDLRVVGRIGVGVDNIDVAAASARGIAVTNVPAYCVDEVAEHVLALALGLWRKIVPYDRAARDGRWSLAVGRPIRRLAGSTFGVVGHGRIGAATARRARAMGLRVIAHAPGLEPGAVDADGVEGVTLADLARRSDIVTLHVPLNHATRHLVDESFLALMKPDAVLINAARGGLIDSRALAVALGAGRLGGAGLDVFEQEPLPADDPLRTAPNTIFTPHVAYYSEDSLRDLARLAAENVARVLTGRRPASVINQDALVGPVGRCGD
jgi:D-3-phosphoglycerate dehydrogenase